MSRFPLRRVALGFAAGAAAGWVAGLLRRPATAPAGSSADEAIHLPREEFGLGAEPAPEHAPPRKATAPAVRPTPGSRSKATGGATGGDAEPAAPAKPGRNRKPAAATAPMAPTANPTQEAAAALREGRAEATELLAGAEAEATPPPAPEPTPAARRRRRPALPPE